MTAAGVGLNKFCYAGLIAAHKNKTPVADDFATKVIIKYASMPLSFSILSFGIVISNIMHSIKKISNIMLSFMGRLLSLLIGPRSFYQSIQQVLLLKI